MAIVNELGLYAFIKNILTQSTVIEGRCYVLRNGAGMINSTNFGEIIKDDLNGIIEKKKYPCALLMPPFETMTLDDKGWSGYRIDMLFLTLDKRTGDHDIKTPDLQTNTSKHTVEQDWKDMREVAGDFKKVFRLLTSKPPFTLMITEKPKSFDQYHRVSMKAADVLNGIHLSFEVRIYAGHCELTDYADVSAIVIPDNFSPHPLHKH